MTTLLFQLGREPALSTAEIHAVFALQKIDISVISEDKKYLIIGTNDSVDALTMMNRLGGTLKIGRMLTPGAETNATIISHLLEAQPEGKIRFSLTGGGGKQQALTIKKTMKAAGHSVRYIEPKNTATILHNGLVERKGDITITDGSIFATEAIQPIEELSKRDYERPGRDIKSGMLPPKLARMMINLSESTTDQTILDPFCGSGTVLMEAMSIGYTHLVGSDLSERAIDDTKKNLAWMQEEQESISATTNIFVSDVAAVGKTLPAGSIDAIVTEPYLGLPLTGNETKKELVTQAHELKELTINAFNAFKSVLKSGGAAIYIIPSFKHGEDWVTINCKKEIEELGFDIGTFSEQESPLRYWRKDQYVKRNIWKFIKR